MVNYIADPVLEKDEVMQIIVNFLKEQPRTQIHSVRKAVERKLEAENVIGSITEGNAYHRTTYNRRISDKDALLINECIYDLLYARVLTPGIDSSNLELPFIHVSDSEKLEKFL